MTTPADPKANRTTLYILVGVVVISVLTGLAIPASREYATEVAKLLLGAITGILAR